MPLSAANTFRHAKYMYSPLEIRHSFLISSAIPDKKSYRTHLIASLPLQQGKRAHTVETTKHREAETEREIERGRDRQTDRERDTNKKTETERRTETETWR